MSEVVTYSRAKADGLKTYYTGRPCVRGHVCERRTSTRQCVECSKLASAAFEKTRTGNEDRKEAARQNSWRRNGMPKPLRPRPERCEICDKQPSHRALHSDHDHVTGKWRGWLCHYCNNSLGLLGDSVAGLTRAIDYLRRAEQ